MPYLSGAAIKGKFRFAALRLATTMGQEDPDDPPLCGQHPGSFCRGRRCVLCRMFGSPWQEAVLVFADAYPSQQELLRLLPAVDSRRALGSAVRANTGIDRRVRTVKRQHLFTTETLPPLEFEGTVEGDLSAPDEAFLDQCALVLTHFGADSARGLGQCRYILSRAGQP